MARDSIRCSFCGKQQEQVGRIIAGPGVYICNECVELCIGYPARRDARRAERAAAGDCPTTLPTPQEIKDVSGPVYHRPG